MTTTVTSSPETRFLTVAEAADELHVTERFIRKLIANRDLDAVRIGTRLVRIRRTDLDGLIRPIHADQPRYRH